MVYVDADSCNDSLPFQLRQNAGAFFGLHQHVVGPAKVAGQIGVGENRFAHRETESKSDHGQGRRR